MLTEERLIAREGARYWWLFLVSGVLWLLIAWMVLRLNATSITTVGVLLGVVFLIAGINEIGMASLAPGGWKVWHYVMAAIFLVGGLWGFIRPVNTFFALASVLGLILVFYGAFDIIRGVASRPGTLRSCCWRSARQSPGACWTLRLAPLLPSSVVLIPASLRSAPNDALVSVGLQDRWPRPLVRRGGR